MFKKMIVALMIVIMMVSLTACGESYSKTTTYTANGVIERYYINGTEVGHDIYVLHGGK